MLSRLLRIGVGKRLERATAKIGELESLLTRVAELESSLRARTEAERTLLRRLTDYHVQFELTRQQLGALKAQASQDALSWQRERARANSAETDATRCRDALAASERRLADMTSGRAELHAELEREHALRVLAEQTVRRQQLELAGMEERLVKLAEGMELTVSTLSKSIAARRTAYDQIVPSLTQLTGRVNLLWERVAPRAARVHEDQHLRFYLTADGYELTEADGPPPRANTVVDHAERGPGVVLKLGRSPLPGDDRWCAYLLPCEGAGEPSLNGA